MNRMPAHHAAELRTLVADTDLPPLVAPTDRTQRGQGWIVPLEAQPTNEPATGGRPSPLALLFAPKTRRRKSRLIKNSSFQDRQVRRAHLMRPRGQNRRRKRRWPGEAEESRT